MRLAPVPIFYHPDREQILHFSGESARTTHGMAECIYASRLFGDMLNDALSGKDKNAIFFEREPEPEAPALIQEIALGSIPGKRRSGNRRDIFCREEPRSGLVVLPPYR
jgi:ADP-ribosyl-[dinitrogen reductase] hydrolase